VSTGRLEAFSDGVIAVIITVLVLELKLPAQDGWSGLRAVAPTLFIYLLTFVQIGIYWVNHHYLTDEAHSATHAILWANLAFLFCLSLFPFATLWVGAMHLSSFSIALYSFVSLLPGISFGVLANEIREASPAPSRFGNAKQRASIALYALAIPAAYIRPWLSLFLLSFVAVMWLRPPRPPAEK
jgi:uncharacterized membrane protein